MSQEPVVTRQYPSTCEVLNTDVLSFDIGTRHLAACIVRLDYKDRCPETVPDEVRDEDIKVIRWEMIDLGSGFSINAIVVRMIEFFNRQPHFWIPETILLEHQDQVNNPMRNMAQAIQACFVQYWIDHGKPEIAREIVIFSSAGNKLKLCDASKLQKPSKSQKYAEDKARSVTRVKRWFAGRSDLLTFLGGFSKQDDLCDCFLQACWYVIQQHKTVLKEQQKQAKADARAAKASRVTIRVPRTEMISPEEEHYVGSQIPTQPLSKRFATKRTALDLTVTTAPPASKRISLDMAL